MKLHGNAALSLKKRMLLVSRVVDEDWSLTKAAAAAEVSERTAGKWVRRFVAEGRSGLLDRSSAPKRVHNRTDERRIQVIACLRRLRMTGAEIAEVLRMPATTVSGILTAIGMGRLGRLGLEPAQSYERKRPGELIHVDVKKLGRIERGAGKRWRDGRKQHYNRTFTDAAGKRRNTVGWEYVHVAVDDATRMAYVEVLADEKAKTAVAFLGRANSLLPPLRRQGRARHHRQWVGLSLHGPRARLPHPWPQTPAHTALSAADQRQSRALHPHDAGRLGLRRDLRLFRRAHRRP